MSWVVSGKQFHWWKTRSKHDDKSHKRQVAVLLNEKNGRGCMQMMVENRQQHCNWASTL